MQYNKRQQNFLLPLRFYLIIFVAFEYFVNS